MVQVAVPSLKCELGARLAAITTTNGLCITTCALPSALSKHHVVVVTGHAVFPSLYTAMKNKTHFTVILVASFAAVIAMYAVMAVLG